MSTTNPCNCGCHIGTGTPGIEMSPNGCGLCWANHPQPQSTVNYTVDYGPSILEKLDRIIELLEYLNNK